MSVNLTPTATVAKNAYGHPATGIPPVTDCPAWCIDPGHVAETGRVDQKCYSEDTYIDSSLDEVEINEYGVLQSRIGIMARRGFNQNPGVLVHIEGFRGDVDLEVSLTAAEATRIAELLVATANLIQGGGAA